MVDEVEIQVLSTRRQEYTPGVSFYRMDVSSELAFWEPNYPNSRKPALNGHESPKAICFRVNSLNTFFLNFTSLRLPQLHHPCLPLYLCSKYSAVFLLCFCIFYSSPPEGRLYVFRYFSSFWKNLFKTIASAFHQSVFFSARRIPGTGQFLRLKRGFTCNGFKRIRSTTTRCTEKKTKTKQKKNLIIFRLLDLSAAIQTSTFLSSRLCCDGENWTQTHTLHACHCKWEFHSQVANVLIDEWAKIKQIQLCD